LKFYSSICLQGLRKFTKTFSHDRWTLYQEMFCRPLPACMPYFAQQPEVARFLTQQRLTVKQSHVSVA
jgi:hypothetical protein